MPETNFRLSLHDGTFFREGNSYGVRFERILDHPASTVWKALTEPAQMVKWLAPATVKDDTISLQMMGGKAGGKIIQWKEPELLEYEWNGGSIVRYELLSEGPNRCRLVFTHSHCIQSQLHGAATGWHYHMDVLKLTLDGQAPPADAAKHWEEISNDAAIRYKAALQAFGHRQATQIAMPR
jgi:hypothetical protein